MATMIVNDSEGSEVARLSDISTAQGISFFALYSIVSFLIVIRTFPCLFSHYWSRV